MIHKTSGIVLHRFKYTDSKVIAKIYTEEFGLQSYMFFGANSKKGRQQINILQPFFPVSLQVYYKETVELQKAKEADLLFPVLSLVSDIEKNVIAQFLSEFIYKVLKENESDKRLFNFLVSSIKVLNATTKNASNFHLSFLIYLSEFLGIQPQKNFSNVNKVFDLQAAKFVIGRPNHNDFLNEEKSRILSSLFKYKLDECYMFDISNSDRKKILDSLITFYNIHLDRPGELKSLKILKEIFA